MTLPMSLFRVAPCATCYRFCLNGVCSHCRGNAALAAAARQGRDVKQARGKAPQSGPTGNAQ